MNIAHNFKSTMCIECPYVGIAFFPSSWGFLKTLCKYCLRILYFNNATMELLCNNRRWLWAHDKIVRKKSKLLYIYLDVIRNMFSNVNPSLYVHDRWVKIVKSIGPCHKISTTYNPTHILILIWRKPFKKLWSTLPIACVEQ